MQQIFENLLGYRNCSNTVDGAVNKTDWWGGGGVLYAHSANILAGVGGWEKENTC